MARLEGAVEELRSLTTSDAEMPVAEVNDALERLLAAELLARRELEAIGERLAQAHAPEVARERWHEMRRRYEERRERLLGPIEKALTTVEPGDTSPGRDASLAAAADARDDLRGLLAELERRASPILRAELPYRPASLPALEPLMSPLLVPAYQRVDAAAPTHEDFGGGAAETQAPLTLPILEQAQRLGGDAVSIFEFVQVEVATEWYAGAMKGAEGTLRQRAGNDVDQASLLIALLRASSFGARYVHGVIELPLPELARMLDIDRPADVPAALRNAGVAARPLVRGGRLQAMEVAHTWVEAYVPYSNYRGAAVDFSGMTWVPLAPALKRFSPERGRFVLRELDAADAGSPVSGAQARVLEYLSRPQQVDPLALIESEIAELLLAEGNGETVDSVLGRRVVDATPLGLLPSTLPATVVAITGEGATVPTELQQRVYLRVLASDGVTPAGAPGTLEETLLELELPVNELAARRVTLSFLPATLEDHQTTMLFGSLYATPAYLLELRPQIAIDGRRVEVGEGTLRMASRARLELKWAPAGRAARRTASSTSLKSSWLRAVCMRSALALSRSSPECSTILATRFQATLRTWRRVCFRSARSTTVPVGIAPRSG